MSCHEYQDLISGYLDDELPQDQRQRLENHLQTCNSCAETLRQLTTMKEELAMLKFKEPSDAELQRYWSGVYNRLERGIGWILFSLGSIVPSSIAPHPYPWMLFGLALALVSAPGSPAFQAGGQGGDASR